MTTPDGSQSVTPSAPAVDLEREREALLAVHALDRRAHFETNIALLLEHAAEDFISVAREEVAEMFEASFRGAVYSAWDDLEPPIVRISADATMAWMIVRTHVRRTEPDEAGGRREREFVYAGIMTHEKRDGRWLRVANVSTFA
jgi:hypothetical protein